jgi:hypothetical protein
MKTFSDFGINVKAGDQGNIKTLCPQCSHNRKHKDDKCLSVDMEKETWNCHNCEWRGCLGNGKSKKQIVDTYDYKDESGKVLFQSVRFFPKGFSQRHSNGNGGWDWKLDGVRRVPYRLPELIASDGKVFIPGGEKDVETLAKHGLTATTNAAGEGNWRKEFNQFFKGRDVVILEDNDEKGCKCLTTYKSLSPLMLEKAGQSVQLGHPVVNKRVIGGFSGPLFRKPQKPVHFLGPFRRWRR